MMKMRRQEREVTDASRINDIIRRCECVNLGCVDGEDAYIVPVNCALSEEDGKRVLYIHGAQEGRKAALIREKGRCSFVMHCSHAVKAADAACDFTYYYQSVMGKGSIAFVDDTEKKAAALNLIMGQYSDKSDWEFPAAVLQRTGLIRLEVTELSAKENMAK